MSGFVYSVTEHINSANIFLSKIVSISCNKNDEKLKNLRNCIKQIITEPKKNIYPILYVCYEKSYLFILYYDNQYYIINKEHSFNHIFTKYILSYFEGDISIFCKNKMFCRCIFHYKKNILTQANSRWTFDLDQTIKTPEYDIRKGDNILNNIPKDENYSKKEIKKNILDSYEQLKKNVLRSTKYSIPLCDISCECPCCYHMLCYEVDTFYLPQFDLEIHYREKEDTCILEKIRYLPIEMSEHILSYYKFYYPHKASLLNRDFLNSTRFRKSPCLSYYGVYGIFTTTETLLSTNSIILMKLKKNNSGSFISYFEHIYKYHYMRKNIDIINKLELYLSRFLQWMNYEHRKKYITTEAFRLTINFTRKRTFQNTENNRPTKKQRIISN